MASSNPLQRGSLGCGMFIHQNHAIGGGNGSIMVGMFVCLCLASKNLSEREFFVPARTDLGVKLLTPKLVGTLERNFCSILCRKSYIHVAHTWNMRIAQISILHLTCVVDQQTTKFIIVFRHCFTLVPCYLSMASYR